MGYAHARPRRAACDACVNTHSRKHERCIHILEVCQYGCHPPPALGDVPDRSSSRRGPSRASTSGLMGKAAVRTAATTGTCEATCEARQRLHERCRGKSLGSATSQPPSAVGKSPANAETTHMENVGRRHMHHFKLSCLPANKHYNRHYILDGSYRPARHGSLESQSHSREVPAEHINTINKHT